MFSRNTIVTLKGYGAGADEFQKLAALKDLGLTDADSDDLVSVAQTTQKSADQQGITFKGSRPPTAFKASERAKYNLGWVDEMVAHKAYGEAPNVGQQIDLTLEGIKQALDALQRTRGDDAVLRVLDRLKNATPNINDYLQR